MDQIGSGINSGTMNFLTLGGFKPPVSQSTFTSDLQDLFNTQISAGILGAGLNAGLLPSGLGAPSGLGTPTSLPSTTSGSTSDQSQSSTSSDDQMGELLNAIAMLLQVAIGQMSGQSGGQASGQSGDSNVAAGCT